MSNKYVISLGGVFFSGQSLFKEDEEFTFTKNFNRVKVFTNKRKAERTANKFGGKVKLLKFEDLEEDEDQKDSIRKMLRYDISKVNYENIKDRLLGEDIHIIAEEGDESIEALPESKAEMLKRLMKFDRDAVELGKEIERLSKELIELMKVVDLDD